MIPQNITLDSGILGEDLPIPKRNYKLKKYFNDLNIDKFPELCQQLLEIVKQSIQYISTPQEAKRASAAITALNYANYHFNKFNIGNYVIPNADLSLARGSFVSDTCIDHSINLEKSFLLNYKIQNDPQSRPIQNIAMSNLFPAIIAFEQAYVLDSEKILLISQNEVNIMNIKENKIDNLNIKNIKQQYFCKFTKTLFIQNDNYMHQYSYNFSNFRKPWHTKKLVDNFSSKILCFIPNKKLFIIQTEYKGIYSLFGMFMRQYAYIIKFLTEYSQKIICVSLNVSQKVFACGGSDQKITLWDSKSYKQLQSLNDHNNEITAPEFTFDESLISASSDSIYKIFKSTTQNPLHYQCIFTFDNLISPFIEIKAFNLSNKILCKHQNQMISVWDIDKQQMLVQGNENKASISNVDILPDDSQVLIPTKFSICLKDSTSLQQLQEQGCFAKNQRKIIISEDKTMFATANSQMVYIWRIYSNCVKKVDSFEFKLLYEIYDIKIAKNKISLFILTREQIYKYHIKGGKSPFQVDLPLEINRNQRFSAVHENNLVVYSRIGLHLCNFQKKKVQFLEKWGKYTTSCSLQNLQFFLTVSWKKKNINFINSTTLKPTRILPPPKYSPKIVAPSSNCCKLIISYDKTILIYDVVRQKLIKQFHIGTEITNILWFQDSCLFLVIDQINCQLYSMGGVQGPVKRLNSSSDDFTYSLVNNDSELIKYSNEEVFIYSLGNKNEPWFKHKFSCKI